MKISVTRLKKKDFQDLKEWEILTGQRCPYCGGSTKYVDSSVVYSKSYGPIFLCAKCEAWCGVHKGTSISLGRLANKELRDWKKKAHDALDVLWKRKMEKDGVPKNVARNLCYSWLREKMNLRKEVCHIGMFNVVQCQQVINYCLPYL